MEISSNTPYFFSLENKGKLLFYLGVKHSWDPADSHFDFIKSKWNEFLSRVKNPFVVVESNWRIHNTEVEAILQGGEIDFIAYHCNQKNIPISCFEPDRGSEMNFLLKQFSKERIEYYYFARNVSQWHRLTQKPDINPYLLSFLQRDKKVSGWDDFVFSIDHMKEIHRQFFGTELNFGDAEFFKKIENPTREDNPFKDLVRASGSYRDQTVVKNIKNVWDQDKDLFVIYGRGHALNHERLLRDFNKI
ncbi:MAG: hypothetical protein M1324_00830 [Patescibacteria group bacterium]|nr:hypothetical protein [Patescibacteria group bacterium]